MNVAINERAEEWKAIPGLERYRVSSLGRVVGPKGKILALKICKRGYAWFCVANGRGSSANISVARSVCAAFHGLPSGKVDSDHINRVRSDNRPENLRWVSRSVNLSNRQVRAGAEHHLSKLTTEAVNLIRTSEHYRGFDRDMADRLGVSRETVRDARLGKLWRHSNAA